MVGWTSIPGMYCYEWKSIWLNWATTQLKYKAQLINGDAKVMTASELQPAIEGTGGFLSSFEADIKATGIPDYLDETFPDPSPYEVT